MTQPNLTPRIAWRSTRNVMLARAQQAHVEILEGKDPIEDDPRVRAARKASRRSSSATTSGATWRTRLGGTPLDRLIRDAEGIDVRVFPQ